MHVDFIENALFSAAVNPWLKALISQFDGFLIFSILFYAASK